MSHISRYAIWVHRSPQSLFGGASNPVIRNGSLLFFTDEGRARVECDQLNAHSGNPHVHYTVQFIDGPAPASDSTLREFGAWSRLRLGTDMLGSTPNASKLVSPITEGNDTCPRG